ncbi:MAG: type II secretion system protein GspN [Deltaproteobacteria bacterium]|nr:type II secretion system protein GspN [Deltaproteobacteria bacterium]
MKLFLRLALYGVTFFFFFLLFLLTLFPYDSIKGRITRELENGLGGAYQVTINKIRPFPLLGVVLKNVQIKEARSQNDFIKLDKASLSLRLLPLLWGSVQTRFDAKIGKGELEGSFASGRNRYHVSLSLDGINLGELKSLATRYGLNLSSQISGQVDLELFPAEPIRNQGSVHLVLKELRLLESELKVGEGEMAMSFNLPPLQMAVNTVPSVIDMRMDKGNMEVKSFEFKGGDLELNLSGKLYIAQSLSNSRLNLKGSFGVNPAASSRLPFLVLIEKEKGSDGQFPLTVTGRVEKPSIQIGSLRVPL